MPRIERLKQNTAEWHRWRLQGIGASDAPVVMGDAPFRTRRVLWSVKTGLARETAVGPAARRGRALEYAARGAYERHTGIQMEPLCLVHDGLEWMRASLDGLSFDGAIALEIKCPWGDRDQAALSAGRIPAHYYAQVQHQLEVSGAEELNYWSFDGRAGTLVKVTAVARASSSWPASIWRSRTARFRTTPVRCCPARWTLEFLDELFGARSSHIYCGKKDAI